MKKYLAIALLLFAAVAWAQSTPSSHPQFVKILICSEENPSCLPDVLPQPQYYWCETNNKGFTAFTQHVDKQPLVSALCNDCWTRRCVGLTACDCSVTCDSRQLPDHVACIKTTEDAETMDAVTFKTALAKQQAAAEHSETTQATEKASTPSH